MIFYPQPIPERPRVITRVNLLLVGKMLVWLAPLVLTLLAIGWLWGHPERMYTVLYLSLPFVLLYVVVRIIRWAWRD